MLVLRLLRPHTVPEMARHAPSACVDACTVSCPPRWGVFMAMSQLWPGVCWGGDAEVNHLLEALMSGFLVAPW